MMLRNRIKKLEEKVSITKPEIHLIGWANCEWKEAEGLARLENESKSEFIKRVISNNPHKKIIWFF